VVGTITCTDDSMDPSFTSRNVKVFCARTVRTQPWMVTARPVSSAGDDRISRTRVRGGGEAEEEEEEEADVKKRLHRRATAAPR
jgi:hypothetical protein